MKHGASMQGHSMATTTLGPGFAETLSFTTGTEKVEGFSLGQDALVLKNSQSTNVLDGQLRLSDANDFIGLLNRLDGPSKAASPIKVSVTGEPESADLLIEFRDPNGMTTDSVTLLGTASDIGVPLLKLAGAHIDMGGAGHAGHRMGATTLVSEQIDDFATHVAVTDGDWNDPSTWENGEIPGEGAIVHIPADISVTYGENAGDAHIFYVHVDGDFAMTSAEGVSRLTVDTIFTTAGSSFEADATSGNLLDIVVKPFDANQIDGLTDYRGYQADGRQINDGSGVLGRFDWDPSQLSLGVVTEGRVKILGQEKTEHLELDVTATQGANTITLDLAPLGLDAGQSNAEILEALGWSEGDLITVGSSEFRSRGNVREGKDQQTEEREVVDLRIADGKLEVVLDRVLDHDHRVKQLDTDLDGTTDTRVSPSVANLSKSLQIRSDVTTQTNDDGFVIGVDTNLPARTMTKQGHTMFMHNTDVQIEDAAFAGMGRSDKQFLLDDKILDKNEETQLISPIGDAEFQDITNMRGRYAVHLHMSGFEDSGDKDEDDAFDYGGAHVSGNLVWGSPGWGFAHHGGLATLTDNVAYDVFGSGFISETGDEKGVWANNLSLLSAAGAPRGAEEVRSPNQDFGATGVGFWLESRMIEVYDNKAQDLAGSGFFIDGAGGSSKTIAVEDLPEWLLPYANSLDRAGGYDGLIHARDIPLMRFSDNTSIGTNHGVWFEDGVQEVQFTFGRIEREGGAVEHDLMSLILDQVSSEVGRAGLFTRNTSQITVDGLVTSGTFPSNSLKQAFAGAAYRESTEVTFFDSYLDDFRKGQPAGAGLGSDRMFSQDIIQNGLTGAADLSVVKVTLGETTSALYPDGNKQGFDEAFGESGDKLYSTLRTGSDGSEVFASTPQVTNYSGDIYTPDRFTTILGTKSDEVAYTPQGARFSRLNQELVSKIRVTDETYLFDTAEVTAGSADPGAYVTGIWGVKIDSVGASYGPFTDQRNEGVDIDGVGEELAMALTVSDLEYLIARNGVVEVAGERFLLMQDAFSDRVSTEVEYVHYAIKLNGTHWDQFETTATFDNLDFGLAKDDVGEVSFEFAGRTYTEHENFTGTDQRDAIFGQFGDDQIDGGSGQDYLHGGAGDDTVRGQQGDDTLIGGSGNDSLDGGTGQDVAIFDGSIANYALEEDGEDVLRVTDLVGNGGVDRLRSVETLQFDDFELTLSDDLEVISVLGVETPGTVSGRMFTDLDGKGVFDGDDTAATGHLVRLFDENGQLVASTRTTEDGAYSFDNVAAGNGYFVRFYRKTDQTDFVISDGSSVGSGGHLNSAAFRVAAGQNVERNALFQAPVVEDEEPDVADDPVENPTTDPSPPKDEPTGDKPTGDDTPKDEPTGDEPAEDTADDTPADDPTDTSDPGDRPTDEVPNDDPRVSGEGDDMLVGDSGNDTLLGYGGDDTVNGGTGADLLNGGPGSDVIVVDNIGDKVVESSRWDGEDTVISSVDFRMGRSHIEDLRLVGDARLGAGNNLANEIRGNNADNVLDGGRNVDTLMGGNGDDRYLVRSPGDVVVETAGAGRDTVLAFRSHTLEEYVERLYLQTVRKRDGDPLQDMVANGNDLDNTLVGNPYDNVLAGREGRDTMKGQGGADRFSFDTAFGPRNVDRIVDFNAEEGDTIAIRSELVGLVRGELATEAFHQGRVAEDADDRLIFDANLGRLYYDADGSGAGRQVLITTFDGNPTLGAADIEIF